MNWARWLSALVILALLLVPRAGLAHSMGFGSIQLQLELGHFSGELILDSPPEYTSDAASDSASDSARLAALKQQIERGLILRFDGEPAAMQTRVVSLGTGPAAVDTVAISGAIPERPTSVTISASYDVGDIGVELTGALLASGLRGMVAKQTTSADILLGPSPPQQPWTSFEVVNSSVGEVTDLATLRPAQVPVLPFLDYVYLGFRHIVPKGADHLLFVLGLLLISTLRPGKWTWLRDVAMKLSVFTVAHSITLAVGALGWVQIRPVVIEPLIALSIVYIGVEVLLLRWRSSSGRSREWRGVGLVFAFGLLHGLAFASSLSLKGASKEVLVRTLLGFNLGVELAQILVAVTAGIACITMRERHWYFRLVLAPASVAISVMGGIWFAARIG